MPQGCLWGKIQAQHTSHTSSPSWVWERAGRSSPAPTDPNGMAGGEGGCSNPKLTWQSILDILSLSETQFPDIFYLFTHVQHGQNYSL